MRLRTMLSMLIAYTLFRLEKEVNLLRVRIDSDGEYFIEFTIRAIVVQCAST